MGPHGDATVLQAVLMVSQVFTLNNAYIANAHVSFCDVAAEVVRRNRRVVLGEGVSN